MRRWRLEVGSAEKAIAAAVPVLSRAQCTVVCPRRNALVSYLSVRMLFKFRCLSHAAVCARCSARRIGTPLEEGQEGRCKEKPESRKTSDECGSGGTLDAGSGEVVEATAQ
jgi:hypothetical protein